MTKAAGTAMIEPKAGGMAMIITMDGMASAGTVTKPITTGMVMVGGGRITTGTGTLAGVLATVIMARNPSGPRRSGAITPRLHHLRSLCLRRPSLLPRTA
jgi:hypothetical protein